MSFIPTGRPARRSARGSGKCARKTAPRPSRSRRRQWAVHGADVWIDVDGLVRTGELLMEMTFHDLGADVDIEVPTDAVDLSGLLGLAPPD